MEAFHATPLAVIAPVTERGDVPADEKPSPTRQPRKSQSSQISPKVRGDAAVPAITLKRMKHCGA